MAKQVVQVNIMQDASGTGVRLIATWTSDGYVCATRKVYIRQQGGYTIDALLVERVVDAVHEELRNAVRQGQIF